MKTDVVIVSNEGDGKENALLQAEKAAAYRELTKKQALHLRLLTEEMLGMMESIASLTEGKFWIEDEDVTGELWLHMKTDSFVDFDRREKLLSVSTSGKNEAARGFMGKIRTFFDPVCGLPLFFDASPDTADITTAFSLTSYRQLVKAEMNENDAAAEAWDELETSVVTHLADDVKVSIQGPGVELFILKNTNKA